MVSGQATTSFLIHYDEIGLKKGNRGFFENRLKMNILKALNDIPFGQVRNDFGRLVLDLASDDYVSVVRERLRAVLGIAHFRIAFRGSTDVDILKEQIFQKLSLLHFNSFKIETRRSDKSYPLQSVQVNTVIGERIHTGLQKRVDLDNAELTCIIEIFNQKLFFSIERIDGHGGLPVGCSGRVISLLSAGIDSPVASFRMMTRGCTVVFVHFHSFPFTEKSSIYNALELAKKLTVFQNNSRIYFVPLANIQQAIIVSCPAKLRVIIYRRMMLRLAEKIAAKEKAKALITGDSLGQVASQTLENIVAISEVATLPILRPLVGMDKEEIVKQARELGTYMTSIEPYADCCNYLVPKSPETKAKLNEVHAAEKRIPNLEELLTEALHGIEVQSLQYP